MTPAISVDRWQLAQQYEAEYWRAEARNPDKLLTDIADGHRFTAGLLGISAETVAGLRVLDIAGGPYPLGGNGDLGLSRYAVLDPAEYPPNPYVERIRARAEGWRGDIFDQIIAYNVLQHVVDPAEVMATARACALRTIRWFDVVDTPIYPVHPHSVSAEWLRQQMSMDGFKIVRDIDGSRLVEGARQKFVALVAERV
jgi:hypothetical protein